jgi:hypothetical protein
MPNQNPPIKRGAVFLVPLVHHGWGVGQILGAEPQALGSVACACFDIFLNDPQDVVPILDKSHCCSLLLTFSNCLDNRRWPIREHRKVELPLLMYPQWKVLRLQGGVGAHVKNEAAVETLLSAYHRQIRWNYLPNGFTRELLPGRAPLDQSLKTPPTDQLTFPSYQFPREEDVRPGDIFLIPLTLMGWGVGQVLEVESGYSGSVRCALFDLYSKERVLLSTALGPDRCCSVVRTPKGCFRVGRWPVTGNSSPILEASESPLTVKTKKRQSGDADTKTETMVELFLSAYHDQARWDYYNGGFDHLLVNPSKRPPHLNDA